MARPITITSTDAKVRVDMAVHVDGTLNMCIRKEGVRVRRILIDEVTGEDLVKIHYPNGEDTDLHYLYVNGINGGAEPTSNLDLFNQLDAIL